MNDARDIILFVLLGWLSVAGTAGVALLWKMSIRQEAHGLEIKQLRESRAKHSEKIQALEARVRRV